MNDETLGELKIVVERTVRPLRASLARKHRIREELLDHLTEIVEEEADRLGDPQAAVEFTVQRFGDPEELTRELQATVPRWDRVRAVVENLRVEPGESTLHFFGKQLIVSVLFYGLMLLLLLPVLWIREPKMVVPSIFLIALIATLAQACFSAPFILLADRMGRALHGSPSERSLRRAVRTAVASLGILPLLTLIINVIAATDTAFLLFHLKLACYFAPLIPMLIVLLSRQAAEDAHREEEWARLEIAE